MAMISDEMTWSARAEAVGAATGGRRTILAGGAIDIGAPSAFALAAMSGLIYAAAFPPLSWSMAAWLALVPLLVACAALSPRRAAVAGMCWTVCACAGVAWCLPGMLLHYFGLAAMPSALASMAIVGLQGLYFSAYAAWVAWLAQRRAANPILLAGGWLACEFARAQSILGSPWALTAYSQLGWTPLIQIADLAGPYGIGMLVAAVNACAAALLVPSLRGRRPRLTATAIAATVAAALFYGQWRLAETFADGPPIAVAVVQGGATPADRAARSSRLERYVALTRRDVDADARLIVWPEYATEAYLDEVSPARDAVLRTAAESGADLVLGGPHYTPSVSGTRYHNSVYLVRAGRVAARYDKHRLVPFAEEDRLAWLLGGKPASYTAGQGSFLLRGSDLRLGASLCVESMFPDLARQAVREGAEVLVNLSNDSWFGHPEPARHQLDIAALRAVENRRYLVRAAATGFSAVIDPHGRTLAQSDFDTHQVLNSAVRASHVRSPYQRWGDAFAWAVIAGVAVATLRPPLSRAASKTRRRFS